MYIPTIDEVKEEMTRRLLEQFKPGMTVEECVALSNKIGNDVAKEKKFGPFFSALKAPNAYSVACSALPEQLRKGELTVAIELKDPVLIDAYLRNKDANSG